MLLMPFSQGITIAVFCVCFSGRHTVTTITRLLLAAVGILCISIAITLWQKNKTEFQQESDEDLANARLGNTRKRYPLLLRYLALGVGCFGCFGCFGVLMLVGVVK